MRNKNLLIAALFSLSTLSLQSMISSQDDYAVPMENHEMSNRANQAFTPPYDRWDELTRHVVLTHAISGNSFSGILEANPSTDVERVCNDTENFLIQNIFTPDGTIGSHLNISHFDLTDALPSRPHLHWAWNQLVQPHTAGSWEDSFLCVLEPMNNVEKSDQGEALFGIAPYDTFSFGSHTLSERSTIVVREDIAEIVRRHLKSYRGKIIAYPKQYTCRQAVALVLERNYPNTWHLVDNRGNLVNSRVQNHRDGHPNITYLKKDDGTIIQIIRGSGKTAHHLDDVAYKCVRGQKFSGLHDAAPTQQLETEPYFRIHLLPEMTRIPNSTNNHFFVNGSTLPKESPGLGIIKAEDFYKQIKAFTDPRARHFAKKILRKALFADFCHSNQTAPNRNLARLFETSNACLAVIKNSALSLHNAVQIDRNKQNKVKFFIKSLVTQKKLPASDVKKSLADYVSSLHIFKRVLDDPQHELDEKIRIGDLYANEEKYEEAFKLYEKAALDQNHTTQMEAQLRLADLYAKGLGCKQDSTKARLLYAKIATQNSNKKAQAEAQFMQGLFSQYGLGGDINRAEAFALYTQAASQEENVEVRAEAQLKLAGFYEQGIECTKNAAIAATLCREASQQNTNKTNQPLAQLAHGHALEYGLEDIEDHESAFECYQNVATQHDNINAQSIALIKLALLYTHGKGCEQSNELARTHFEQAAQNNNALAQQYYAYELDPIETREKKLLQRLKSLNTFNLARLIGEADFCNTTAIKNNAIIALSERLLQRSELNKFKKQHNYTECLQLAPEIEKAIIKHIEENKLGRYKDIVSDANNLSLKQLLFLLLCAKQRITLFSLGSHAVTFRYFSLEINRNSHLYSIYRSLPDNLQQKLIASSLVEINT